MQSISSVMTFGMNKILIGFSETAVAVFGVYFKLQSFIFMPIFGLNNGMIPIVAYNYGARSKKRIMETVWLSIGIAVGIMLIGLMVFHLMTPQLLMLFQAGSNKFNQFTKERFAFMFSIMIFSLFFSDFY